MDVEKIRARLHDRFHTLVGLFFVKGILTLLATVLVGCSSGTKHADIKVKALHAWERGRAKNCMLLTGQPIVQGGKPTPDPKEMWCSDQRKTDPDEMNWEYVHIANVTLDNPSEQAFHDSQKWAVPLVCERSFYVRIEMRS